MSLWPVSVVGLRGISRVDQYRDISLGDIWSARMLFFFKPIIHIDTECGMLCYSE